MRPFAARPKAIPIPPLQVCRAPIEGAVALSGGFAEQSLNSPGRVVTVTLRLHTRLLPFESSGAFASAAGLEHSLAVCASSTTCLSQTPFCCNSCLMNGQQWLEPRATGGLFLNGYFPGISYNVFQLIFPRRSGCGTLFNFCNLIVQHLQPSQLAFGRNTLSTQSNVISRMAILAQALGR